MNKVGSGDKVLDWGVIIAAGVLFPKTADILSYFSPLILNEIFGFNVSLIYGVVNALLVEGLALALHFNKRAALSGTAQTVKWILLAISGACQVFDGFVVTNTLAGQSDTMKAILAYGVPLIPLFIMIMVFGIGHLPEVGEDGEVVVQPRKPFKGVKKIWKGFLEGEESTVLPPEKVVQTNLLDIPKAKVKSDNGEREKDFTKGERS